MAIQLWKPIVSRHNMLLEPARDKVYRQPTFDAIPDEVENL